MARFYAWQEAAQSVDQRENEKPVVDFTHNNPDLTDEQVAHMKQIAEPAPKEASDLEKWAYDQGRAIGITSADAAVKAGYSASDIEHKALEEEELGKTTKALLARKHQGIAKGLHRVAAKHYDGQALVDGKPAITTTASEAAPKPNVKYVPGVTGMGAPSASGWGGTGAATFSRTSEEDSAIHKWTADYRFETQTAFIKAINRMLQGKPAGTGTDARLAELFMNLVENKSTPSQATIYRGTDGGEFAGGQFAQWKEAIGKGQTVVFDMPISSSTYSSGVWAGHSMRYVVDPGALTADIGQYGGIPTEVETVTGGMMEVYKIEKKGDTTYVYMRQLTHYVH
jgi:hypothetical protein